MIVAHHSIRTSRQGFGISTPDPRRAGELITPGQVKAIRVELEILGGNENVLIALVCDATRSNVTRLEDFNGYQKQMAFQLLLRPDVREALKTKHRGGQA